jgi:hypothetical protein
MFKYLSYNAKGWQGQIENNWQSIFIDIGNWLEENPGLKIVDQPSREVRKIETTQGVVYAKIMRRANNSEGLRKIPPTLKWYLRPSRALAIMRISQELLSAGFDCPIPILAARRRSKTGWPEDISISLECHGVTIKDRLKTLNDVEESQPMLDVVAAEIYRFHQAGFVHGDCIPGNLALTDDKKIIFFDNDRTVRHPFRPLQYIQRRNLIQFGFRLTHQMNTLDPFRTFLETYAAYANWSKVTKSTETEKIMASIKKRLVAKDLTSVFDTKSTTIASHSSTGQTSPSSLN